MAGKSRILIIGGTGYIGKSVVEASVKEGHPTFALVRESTVSDPVKGKIVENFKSLGVNLIFVSFWRNLSFLGHNVLLVLGHGTLEFSAFPGTACKKRLIALFVLLGLQGDLYDHGSLVAAFKQVDVVISTVGIMQFADQTKIISAIKEAGNIKVLSVSFSSKFRPGFDPL